jgi:hypothetical protein
MTGRAQKIIDQAFRLLKKAKGDRHALPEAARNIVLVSSAQGLIDIGGLQYFFESNFEDLTPYAEFCAAYHAIGATAAGDLLQEAVAMFPIEETHLHADQRNRLLEHLWSTSDRFATLDNKLCGDDTVWEMLDAYAMAHKELQ